jgi:hypothetical protein
MERTMKTLMSTSTITTKPSRRILLCSDVAPIGVTRASSISPTTTIGAMIASQRSCFSVNSSSASGSEGKPERGWRRWSVRAITVS